MPNVLETLVVKLEGDARQFNDSVDKAKDKTSAFSSMATGAMMGVGMAAVNLGVSAAASFAGFASDGIAMASDLGETMSKVGVVFGDWQEDIIEWGEASVTALGMSKNEAMGAAATFGNLFQSMGIGLESTTEMSTGLVELAADLASFNNIDPGVALEKLRAGMLGQSEPMQALGVNMTAAMTSAKALEMGLAATTAELTPAMLAQARYALILEQTTLAQGDFARTSEGLANQQRIADANWKELQTTLGTALLPVLTTVTSALNKFLTAILPPLAALLNNVVIPAFNAVATTIMGLYDILMGTEPLGDWSLWWEKLVPLIGEDAADAVHGFGEVILGLKRTFDQNIGPMIESAKKWFGDLKGSIDSGAIAPLNFLNAWIAQNMPRIQQIVSSVLAAIQAFWAAHGEKIMSVLGTLWRWMENFFNVTFRTILNIVQGILQLLTGDFEGAGDTLRMILNDWKSFFEYIIRDIVNGVRQWFSEVDWGGIGRGIMDGIANGIRNGAGRIRDAAKSAAQSAYDSARSFLGIRSPSTLAAEGIGVPFSEGIAAGIGDAMGTLTSQIAGSLDGLMGGISGGLAGAGAGAGGGAQATITQNFYGVTDAAGVRSASLGGVNAGLRATGAK